MTDTSPKRAGDRERSRAEPGSGVVLVSSLVALALEGLLELLEEVDEESDDELSELVTGTGAETTASLMVPSTSSSGMVLSGPVSTIEADPALELDLVQDLHLDLLL